MGSLISVMTEVTANKIVDKIPRSKTPLPKRIRLITKLNPHRPMRGTKVILSGTPHSAGVFEEVR